MIFIISSILLGITLLIIIKDNYTYYTIKKQNKINTKKFFNLKKNLKYIKFLNNTLITSLDNISKTSDNVNTKLNYNK